jgi:hypothetical protein
MPLPLAPPLDTVLAPQLVPYLGQRTPVLSAESELVLAPTCRVILMHVAHGFTLAQKEPYSDRLVTFLAVTGDGQLEARYHLCHDGSIVTLVPLPSNTSTICLVSNELRIYPLDAAEPDWTHYPVAVHTCLNQQYHLLRRRNYRLAYRKVPTPYLLADLYLPARGRHVYFEVNIQKDQRPGFRCHTCGNVYSDWETYKTSPCGWWTTRIGRIVIESARVIRGLPLPVTLASLVGPLPIF